jgi:hypothetical protein
MKEKRNEIFRNISVLLSFFMLSLTEYQKSLLYIFKIIDILLNYEYDINGQIHTYTSTYTAIQIHI